MLAYRVFPHLPGARPRQPGHPLYLHRPQGRGRWDNPALYTVRYLALDPAAAVAETFANLGLRWWTPAMFRLPALPGATRALGVYRLDDGTALLDLDDPVELAARSLRPTQVLSRNRAQTQAIAARVHGEGRWDGLRWWSYYAPHWTLVAVWAGRWRCVRVEPLDLEHPAVVDAADTLARPIRRR